MTDDPTPSTSDDGGGGRRVVLSPDLSGIGDSVRGALLRRAGRVSARYQERTGLAADLLEDDDAYLAVFDAAGADQSDVQVSYAGGAVLVRIDRFRDYHEGYEMRFPGRGLSLDGEVALPADAVVDAHAANAVLTDRGTLEVTIPKREAPEQREIEVDDVDEDDGAGAEEEHDAEEDPEVDEDEGAGAEEDPDADGGDAEGSDDGDDAFGTEEDDASMEDLLDDDADEDGADPDEDGT